MSWLSSIVSLHDELEAPASFYFWSALTAISAVVKDNIWMDRYIYKLYPNIYTMLHADSGLKKGPPINMAHHLVKNAIGDDNIISGRSSIQGILKELGTVKSSPGGNINRGGAVFVIASELASSIVDDPVATKILTELYDRNYNDELKWKSLLKMEEFKVKNPTISMLTGTNEAMAEGFIQNSAIKGGYIARTFIIHESKRNRPNSLTFPPREKIDYKGASEYLKELSKLKGEFIPFGSNTKTDKHKYEVKDKYSGRVQYGTGAGIIYDKWYYEFTQTLDEQEFKDETGTSNRFGDSVLKVIILMSLAKQPILEIDEETVYESIKVCERLIGNVRKATSGKNGTSVTASLKSMIVMELYHRPNHIISKPLLMKKLMYHFSGESDFNDTMLSMENAGVLKIGNIGPTIVYEMPSEEVEKYRHLFEGKMK